MLIATMPSRITKLQSHQKSETRPRADLEQQATARGFATVEEMLRFDARHTEVPPRIKRRLAESIQREVRSAAKRRGWRKFLP